MCIRLTQRPQMLRAWRTIPKLSSRIFGTNVLTFEHEQVMLEVRRLCGLTQSTSNLADYS